MACACARARVCSDSGGNYRDGTCDTTRTTHFGRPTEEQCEAYTRVLQGHVRLPPARSLALRASLLTRRVFFFSMADRDRQRGISAGDDGPPAGRARAARAVAGRPELHGASSSRSVRAVEANAEVRFRSTGRGTAWARSSACTRARIRSRTTSSSCPGTLLRTNRGSVRGASVYRSPTLADPPTPRLLIHSSVRSFVHSRSRALSLRPCSRFRSLAGTRVQTTRTSGACASSRRSSSGTCRRSASSTARSGSASSALPASPSRRAWSTRACSRRRRRRGSRCVSRARSSPPSPPSVSASLSLRFCLPLRRTPCAVR